MSESQLESAVEEPESVVDPRPFVLDNLGLDEAFLTASSADKEATLQAVEGKEVRKILFRALFYAVVVTAFALQLRGGILVVGCGVMAMFAGRDLARFRFTRRLIAVARGLFLTEASES